jgi:membrane protein implicated in regulation of membrane protease activity
MLELISHSWALWTLVAVAAGFIEILVPYFTFSFVSIGAIVAALVALRFGLEIQCLGFAVTLIVSLVFVRPRLIERFQIANKMVGRNEAMHGLSGIVTEEIDSVRATGRVLVNGQDWAARSDQVITIGKNITVDRSDGIVLIVKGN